MKLSIYEVYVNIEDPPQANRMKQICIDYGLDYNKNKSAFLFIGRFKYFVFFSNNFAIRSKGATNRKTQVTESEFLELVKMLNKC